MPRALRHDDVIRRLDSAEATSVPDPRFLLEAGLFASSKQPRSHTVGRLETAFGHLGEVRRAVAMGFAVIALCAMTTTAAIADQTISYQVQTGDTVLGIAYRFGTSADQIVSMSGLSDPNVLAVGETLTVNVPTASSDAGNVKVSFITSAANALRQGIIGAPGSSIIGAPYLSQFDGTA